MVVDSILSVNVKEKCCFHDSRNVITIQKIQSWLRWSTFRELSRAKIFATSTTTAAEFSSVWPCCSISSFQPHHGRHSRPWSKAERLQTANIAFVAAMMKSALVERWKSEHLVDQWSDSGQWWRVRAASLGLIHWQSLLEGGGLYVLLKRNYVPF